MLLKKKNFFEMKERASDIISSNKEEVLSKDFLPSFLPSMEEVKKKYCVSIYTKGHWFFLSVSLIAEEYAS